MDGWSYDRPFMLALLYTPHSHARKEQTALVWQTISDAVLISYPMRIN